MSTIRTSTVVFHQHDDDPTEEEPGYQPWGTLYGAVPDSVVMHGASTESIIAAAQILAQWDYGDDGHDIEPLSPLLSDHDRWFVRPDRDDTGWIVFTEDWSVGSATGFHDGYEPKVGDYILTAHRRLGYTVLDRVEEVSA